jgi:hypothetical protein
MRDGFREAVRRRDAPFGDYGETAPAIDDIKRSVFMFSAAGASRRFGGASCGAIL